MRILIDTNVLIFAALFPNSIPARAFDLAVSGHYVALVSEQNIEEMHRIFQKKIPSQAGCAGTFFGFLNALMGNYPGAR